MSDVWKPQWILAPGNAVVEDDYPWNKLASLFSDFLLVSTKCRCLFFLYIATYWFHPHTSQAKTTWWFQTCFIFIPKFGEDSHLDWYFSDGLKPPTTMGFYPWFTSWVGFSSFLRRTPACFFTTKNHTTRFNYLGFHLGNRKTLSFHEVRECNFPLSPWMVEKMQFPGRWDFLCLVEIPLFIGSKKNIQKGGCFLGISEASKVPPICRNSWG